MNFLKDEGPALLSAWLLAGIALTGCSEPTSSTTTTTTFTPHPDIPQPTWVSSTGVLDPSSTSDETSEGSSTSSTTGHPDTSSVPPDFGSGDDLCGGKIDVLFVLDRHESMALDQRWQKLDHALQTARPLWLHGLSNFDTHWMVVDGTKHWGDIACEERCAETAGATCAPDGPAEHPCSPFKDGTITDCDETRGAGLTFPAGTGSSNKRCELGPHRYVSSETEDPAAALECITTTGHGDHNSFYAELAMVKAVEPIMTGVPGGCNLGFLRSEALLVVVYVSPHRSWEVWDLSAAGYPSEWADALYAAKNGDKDKLMVLGIVTDMSSEDPTVCEKLGGSLHGTDVESFLYHIKWFVHGSDCAADYTPFFAEGLELALELCGAEIPT